MVDLIFSQESCFIEFGSILKDIEELARSVEAFFNLIPCAYNSVAMLGSPYMHFFFVLWRAGTLCSQIG